MEISRVILAAAQLAGLATLAAGSAQAQLVVPTDKPILSPKPQPQDGAFARSFQPGWGPYMHNEAEIPDVKMFGEDYRVDPKLKAGFNLNPNFGIETGYSNLYSKGYFYVGPGYAGGRDLQLGVGDSPSSHYAAGGRRNNAGSATYVAAKVTVPVDDRLSTFGKVGVARTDRKLRDSAVTSLRETDVGPYANVGADYKLSEKASVSGQYERYGDSARKFGSDTNAGGVSAKLKLGF